MNDITIRINGECIGWIFDGEFHDINEGNECQHEEDQEFHNTEFVKPSWLATACGALMGSMSTVHATVVTKAVPALSGATVAPSIDHAFDPVILMLQQMAFPVASIVLAWACLRAMIGHPAQGVDQAKWAIIGYLAMRYAPEILRHV